MFRMLFQCLLKRYPPMRTRLCLTNNQYLLHVLEYNSDYFSNDYSFQLLNWITVHGKILLKNVVIKNHIQTMVLKFFHFMLVYDDKQSDEQLFHLILFSSY